MALITTPGWLLRLPLAIGLLAIRPAMGQTPAASSYAVAMPTAAGPGEATLERAPATPPLDYAEEMPHFAGGEKAMLAFFQKRLTYSSEAIAHLKAGIISVGFVVDAQGRVLDPYIIRGVGYGLDEEALRLVRLMPWWEPGKTHGQPVPVKCTMPIRFRIADVGTQ